jgi:uncharacterized protein YqjF (DUF2071 family)
MTKQEILKITEHRPFPLPRSPWVMQQSWKDLLFIHYKIPYNTLRALVPQELALDTYNDEAWISITPFKMRNVRFRMLPSVPTATNFLELNLRTYVKLNGKGGIYFFSLDASSILSVMGARAGAFLPYFSANMSVNEEDRTFHFQSKRNGDIKTPAVLDVKYKPESTPFESQKDSLEEWLVERYCLFQEAIKGKFVEIDIHHLKWSLQQAEASILTNSLTKPLGFDIPGQQPLLHFSKYQKVLVWSPKIVPFSKI